MASFTLYFLAFPLFFAIFALVFIENEMSKYANT